jgi:ubiquinone/menaquinone biosynthesis C-methylase UbiE
VSFLDMQAEVGITKHVGGIAATNELLSRCQIEEARDVLNVGCGIGAGSVHIARQYACRVVGIDVSPKMIEWARQRAREARVEARTEFRTADVTRLPFEDNAFDIVFAESVFVFVDDKATAIRECVRVTKPGGYVGLNEGYWQSRPPAEALDRVTAAIGPHVPMLDEWRGLWDASGLEARQVLPRPVDAGAEIKSRVEWIGWRWLIRAWGRALRLVLKNPAMRKAMKDQLDVPAEVINMMGYVLLVGRKPAG